MECPPDKLRKDLELLDNFDRVPPMKNEKELIRLIKIYYQKKINGVIRLEDAENEQLFATANEIFKYAHKRLEIYKTDLKVALSSWGLSDSEKHVILKINDRLRNGEDKYSLEERLYIQLEHLPLRHPLKELFLVLSKNY